MAFERTFAIRFGDVDPAGTVFYPRFFQFFHELFEEFLAVQCDLPYEVLVHRRHIGFPTVHIEADFRKPLRMGDDCRIRLTLVKVGRSSLVMDYHCWNGQIPSSAVRITTVCLNLEKGLSMRIPQDIRKKVLAQLSDPDEHTAGKTPAPFPPATPHVL